MARLWYGHFDSTEEDPRKLLAEDWADYIKSFITNGVRNGGANLEITATGAMAVSMGMGVANIEGYIFRAEADENGDAHLINIPSSEPDLPRIDRVVLRLNRAVTSRTIYPHVICGKPSTAPTAPDLTRDDDVFDISLAQVYVSAGATAIHSENITDERLDPALCGLINSVLGVDSKHWERRFGEFLAEIDANWASQLANQQTNFEAWKAVIDNWRSLTVNELAAAVSFAFDNPSAHPGTVVETVFSSGTITSTMKWKATGATFAQQVTNFLTDGSIEETETVYLPDGNIFRNVKVTTTFKPNIRTEVVSI